MPFIPLSFEESSTETDTTPPFEPIAGLAKNLENYLPHIHKVLSERGERQKVPSPLLNKEALEEWMAKSLAEYFEITIADIVAVVNETATPFSDDPAYHQRLREFTNYIRGKAGENNISRRRLLHSLCDFFLNGHTLEREVLISQFPPQQADFNCFDGICERLDGIRAHEDIILQDLEAAHIAAMSQFHNANRQTMLAGGEDVHADTHIKEMVRGIFKEEKKTRGRIFEVSGLNLFHTLTGYPQKLHEQAEKRFVEDHDISAKIIDIAKKIIADLKAEGTLTFVNNQQGTLTAELEQQLLKLASRDGLILSDEDQEISQVESQFNDHKDELKKVELKFSNLKRLLDLKISLQDSQDDEDKARIESAIEATEIKLKIKGSDKSIETLREEIGVIEAEIKAREDALKIEEAELQKEPIRFFYAQALFAKRFTDAVDKAFPTMLIIQNGHDLLTTSYTDDDQTLMKINFNEINQLYNSSRKSLIEEDLKKLEREFVTESILGLRSDRTKPALDDKMLFSNAGNLAQRLLSENPNEMLEALNAVYALSKHGIGSCVLHVFKADIARAVMVLDGRFKEHPTDPFYQLHNFKLQSYLERKQEIDKIVGAVLILILQGNVAEADFRGLDSDKLLFILCNLSSEDIQVAVRKLSHEQAYEMLTTNPSQFSAEVSASAQKSLFQSLFLRPDFKEIFPLILAAAFPNPRQNQSVKAQFLLKLLVIGREYKIPEADTRFISDELKKINVANVDLRGQEQLLSDILKTKPTPPFGEDSQILRFIPAFFPHARFLVPNPQRGSREETLLAIALQTKHFEFARALLSGTAEKCGRDEVLRLLNEGRVAYEAAKETKSPEIIAILDMALKAYKPSAQEALSIMESMPGYNGWSPLREAIENNNNAFVNYAIDIFKQYKVSSRAMLDPVYSALHSGVVNDRTESAANLYHRILNENLVCKGDALEIICRVHSNFRSILDIASMKGNAEMVKILLEPHASLSLEDSKKLGVVITKCLIEAVTNNYPEVIDVLLARLSTLNIPPERLISIVKNPLRRAASVNHENALTFLKLFVDLVEANATSDKEIFDTLYSQEGNVFIDAAKGSWVQSNQNTEVVKYLLKKINELDISDAKKLAAILEPETNGNTALSYALRSKRFNLVEDIMTEITRYKSSAGEEIYGLLSRKSPILEDPVLEKCSHTILTYAIGLSLFPREDLRAGVHSFIEALMGVIILLPSKAIALKLLSVSDDSGRTPIDCAAEVGDTKVIKALSNAIQSLKASSKEAMAILNHEHSKTTTLMRAVQKGHIDSAIVLIDEFKQCGASNDDIVKAICAKPDNKNNAISCAVNSGCGHIITMLGGTLGAMGYKKIIDEINQTGSKETSLMHATRHGFSSVIRSVTDIIINCHASPDKILSAICEKEKDKDKDGKTLLMIAAESGKVEVVESIINAMKKSKALPTLILRALTEENKKGQTALTLSDDDLIKAKIQEEIIAITKTIPPQSTAFSPGGSSKTATKSFFSRS